ncbi:unnamed protein product [Sphenostylis stenocarpa]|uniref:CLAVATA3/ESR (CLE)-related protein 13 n=1 Tax=Sphenostylis stenocarpa TaxID=92480 RepID=A0AA86SDF9_9FABA|nr:unnamed protein product [Sphenostylis stenocarpa]
MALIIRLQHLLSLILWLFLLSLLFHAWFGFNSHYHNQPHFSLYPNRKILATAPAFDFTPFLHHHHHHHRHHHRRHHHRSHMPDPKLTEIDPRFGVEKRLVPTGPNPLHH